MNTRDFNAEYRVFEGDLLIAAFDSPAPMCKAVRAAIQAAPLAGEWRVGRWTIVQGSTDEEWARARVTVRGAQ